MWEDVEFSILHPADPAPAKNGFSLDIDVAKQVLQELLGYQDRLGLMKRKVSTVCSMKPPSKDPSTMAMHVAMVGDGRGKLGAFSYGGGHIDLQLDYVTELIDRIRKALAAIGQSDQDQAAAVEKTHPGTGSRGNFG
ncbi:hypothetical protein [Amycolatopsis echigonensis]|uniref:Uncharacterized protein n=1 Tax=Amycolatopsis echigonensis TaxID=2576905 RepID=A0A8E2B1A0_9PSEU|nr:hypothetical protein [Amycolatopsis echigonensis]MBB2499501.1 hypothetical protein [Amycolatopsis echigonensis]